MPDSKSNRGRYHLLLAYVAVLATSRPSFAAETAPSVEIVSVSSGRRYSIGTAEIGKPAYVDRRYAIRVLPKSLVGSVLVLSSMDDDYAAADDHLQLQLKAPATVTVATDRRGHSRPEWLKDWTPSKESISVDDVAYHLSERSFSAGKVTLGGNDRRRTGAPNNYVVLIVPGTPAPPFPAAEFATKVRPLLATQCFDCHGPNQQEGGLRLDVRRRAFAGGDTGVAITPGSSRDSELLARVVSTDAAHRMPQGSDPLSVDKVTLLRRWIEGGAPWPDDLAGKEDLSDHWSFRPIERPPVPAVRHRAWIRNPIDAFVLDRLERASLAPSPEADRRTLLRRLRLDLTGLPPSAEEIHDFVEDDHPDAYERVVDRFLASPQFGERWAKHWLDLARFAESDGYENDNPRPHAWRYRNWVIDAINDDLPFDEFTHQQLAGDLLPEAGAGQRIATAFHRNTLYNSAGGADKEEFRTRAVKDRASSTAAIWMGLTLNCSECHSHKYDPIAHREFYQFYAYFNDAEDASEDNVPVVKATQREARVHKRGNFLDLGPRVDPGVPGFLPPSVPRASRGDRLDLARWLTSANHPLTARVAVNHLWQHLFGAGLVSTPENFGRKGEPPSHPELLDWLACEFMGQPAVADNHSTTHTTTPAAVPSGRRAWSRKALIRQIVLSATYRQSSVHREEPPAADPDNRLLWRQNRFRVEAETVRDLALTASGLIDATVGGPSVQPSMPRGLGKLGELKGERFVEPHGNPHRRGLYVHMQRTFPYPMFAAFDAPDGNQCTMSRDRSTTPMQALTLLNEPALDECARSLGKRLMQASNDRDARIATAFEQCLSRPPTPSEFEVIRTLIVSLSNAGASETDIWHGVARTLLNLDEFITRE